jgi:phosphopantothenoylcysteine decarboxylase/phosphopantothenate--cysteine ligase
MPIKLLITAGPTHEPIDAVRFLGNRSSGRMGVALADAAASLGFSVTLLLGPVHVNPRHAGVRVERFRTVDDLQALLKEHVSQADGLIMAAAVADYRPKPLAALSGGKFRRTAGNVSLELEPTPDLLAGVGATRRAEQLLIGFALEPRDEMLSSARRKIEKKNIDVCVANPLETMDAADIEAVIVHKDGELEAPPSKMPKDAFAAWMMSRYPAWAKRGR